MARAAEKAYRTVRERILRGEYPSALRITEQEIADATGVSRTPVREALRRLQAEGFVTVIANQGALPIKVGDDVIGAAGASGAPGGEKDEACIKAALDKVADELK